jgi:uncharacterized protein YbjT (DUF2867 family)
MAAARRIASVMTASSNSGSAAVRRLLQLGADGLAVRAVFRSETAAERLRDVITAASGVDSVIGCDASAPESLAPAFEGAKAAIIVCPHAVGADMGKDADLTANMVNEAKNAGVEHIVFVGSWTVGAAEALPTLAGRFAPTEALLKDLGDSSGLKWTVLRSGFFFPNFAAMLGSLRTGDSMVFPDLRIPAVDPADIGNIAASIVADGPNKHHGKCYDISGPDMLSSADIASTLAKHLERPITHDSRSAAEYASAMPPFLQELFAYLEAKQDSALPLSTDVLDTTGHEPRSFEDWVRANKDAFARTD